MSSEVHLTWGLLFVWMNLSSANFFFAYSMFTPFIFMCTFSLANNWEWKATPTVRGALSIVLQLASIVTLNFMLTYLSEVPFGLACTNAFAIHLRRPILIIQQAQRASSGTPRAPPGLSSPCYWHWCLRAIICRNLGMVEPRREAVYVHNISCFGQSSRSAQ